MCVSAQEIHGPYPVADLGVTEDYPDVAVDSDNGFHVIYRVRDYDNEKGWLEYKKVSPSGDILKGPITLSDPRMVYISSYDIVVDSSDRVHITFSGLLTDEVVDLFYMQLTKDGTIEVAQSLIPNPVEHQVSPSMDVDASGNIYIAYTAWNGNFTSVRWTKLSSSGSVLIPSKRISEELEYPDATGPPTICVGSDGRSHVFYTSGTYYVNGYIVQSDVYFTALTSTGRVDLEPAQVLANEVADYWGVEAAIDSNDALHLAFIVRDPVRSDALGYARIEDNGNLIDEQRLDDPRLSGEAWWPDIDVDPSDDVFVVYQRMSNDNLADWNIFMLRSEDGGRNWDDSLQLTTDDASQSTRVAAGFGVEGVVYGTRHQDVSMVIVGDVVDNTPPVARLSASPTDPGVGEEVEFDGRESYDPDADDNIDGYFFDFGDGRNSGWVRTPRIVYTNGYGTTGTYIATLRVRDTYGRECETPASVTITVLDEPTNDPPAAILIATPAQVDIDEPISFNGSASTDSDGYVSEYNFDLGDGTTSGWVVQSTINHAYHVQGTYTVSLRVRDDDGAESGPAVVEVYVVHENVAPTATIVSISPGPVTEGEEVTFTGMGEDVDGSVVVYNWLSDLDGLFGYTATTSSSLSVGTHVITFRVKDNEDAWSEDVTQTLVVNPNRPFVLVDETRKPETIHEDTKMEFLVTYTDPENDPPTTTNLLYAKDGTWREVPLTEKDPSDKDFTDGKEYFLDMTFRAGKWKYAFEFDNAMNARQTTEERDFTVLEEGSAIPSWGLVPVITSMLIACILAWARHRR